MTGLEDTSSQPAPPEETHSRGRRVRDRIVTRNVLLSTGAIFLFLLSVGLLMYFKPGSTAEPSGEPSLDLFAAGPEIDYEPGHATLFQNEHFFLVRLEDGDLLALYDLSPANQALVEAGDQAALECRAVLRTDEEMAGWLARADVPPGFEDRGIWDECTGAVWTAAGEQVRGPDSGDLDRFPVRIVDGIVRVDLASRLCRNPVSPEAPCIQTQ